MSDIDKLYLIMFKCIKMDVKKLIKKGEKLLQNEKQKNNEVNEETK